MKLAALFLLPILAGAQVLTLTAPARAYAGQIVPVVLSLGGMAGNDLAALQWTLTPGVSLPAAQPLILNKARLCAPSASVCMVVGIVPSPIGGVISPTAVMNAFQISQGPLQNLSVQIPGTAQPGDVITVRVGPVIGATAAADPVYTVSVVPASITVADPLDLNQDGSVNQADHQMALYLWRAAPTDANFLMVSALARRLRP